MHLLKFPAAALVSAVLSLATLSPAFAVPGPAPRTLVIGVDHLDPANQQPDKNRVFEYTDFFSRSVRIHTGDTLDFRTAPNAFHVIAIAKNEYKAKVAYPVALLDTDDPPAPGTGLPKILLGPSNGAITGGSTSGGGTVGGANDFPPGPCGLTQLGQKPCVFNGGQDVEGQGGVPGFPPDGTDWAITMNAEPGTFAMFCYIHPNMSGEITVVKDSDPNVSTQASIDAASQTQFLEDQRLALAAERDADHVRFSNNAPGKRTYQVFVGVSAADNHVAINEMLPHTLNITRGDAVDFKWRDEHNAHTVSFPAVEGVLPPPFAPEFEAGEAPELVSDPGNAGKGTRLTLPDTVVNSGLLFGRKYYLQPSAQFWGVTTGDGTAAGKFEYMCTLHDFMHGIVNVGP